MSTFVPRTEAPTTDNRYFYADNPFEASGYGLPNCTCYAWGRFWEIGGGRPSLCTFDAEEWWGYSDGYERGQTPKLGAVICWRAGSVTTDADGAGHVAIVEKINADGSIVTSESGWGSSSLWWTKTRTNSDGNWSGGDSIFQGFIYHPLNFDGSGGSEPLYKTHTGNRYLSRSEMEDNARFIWNYLGSRGWSINAVAAMLGNMETESTINPGIWESLAAGNTSGGYGLVQWTPATKYLNWSSERGLEPSLMTSNLKRIVWEFDNGESYYPTDYDISASEFKVSTQSPGFLAMVFLTNYEQPADYNQPHRTTQAKA